MLLPSSALLSAQLPDLYQLSQVTSCQVGPRSQSPFPSILCPDLSYLTQVMPLDPAALDLPVSFAASWVFIWPTRLCQFQEPPDLLINISYVIGIFPNSFPSVPENLNPI